MFRWIGIVCVLIMGMALGANLLAVPQVPPPPSYTNSTSPLSPIGPASPSPAVPPSPPKPASPADQLAGLQLREQDLRTFRWDRGWLRVESVDGDKEKTHVEITVFITEGAPDVLYVEPEGSLLVAGESTGVATRSTFPNFRVDLPHLHHYGTFVYFTDLIRDARHRVPPGQELHYALEFPALAVLPEALYVKVRFAHPRSDTRGPLEFKDGRLDSQQMLLANCRWDTALRREIAALEEQVKRATMGRTTTQPEKSEGASERATPASLSAVDHHSSARKTASSTRVPC